MLKAGSDHWKRAEEPIVLKLLDAIDGNTSITQRYLAQELGIALGLANTYLKRCIRKGFLKVIEAPKRRYIYYVTPQGFAEKSRLTAQYLSNSLTFLRQARNEFEDLFSRSPHLSARRFALIGLGDLADIARLVGSSTGIEIVATIPAETISTNLQKSLSKEAFDVAVITATERPQEVFDAAVLAFGQRRVCAPRLLRIKSILLESAND